MASSDNEDFWFAGISTKGELEVRKACSKVFISISSLAITNDSAATNISNLSISWAAQPFIQQTHKMKKR